MQKNNKILSEAFTFDDVLLQPAYSDILPSQVDVSSYLTKNIKLNIPLISSPMDTVTESSLAIAIALKGGMGIIHKNMTIDDQVKEVKKVKRSQSTIIKDPVTLNKNSTVKDALQIMKKNKIGGIPIVDENNYLHGIVTNRDIRFHKDLKVKLSNIMTSENLITAQNDTDLFKAEQLLKKHKIEKLPIVNTKNILVGLVTYKDILKNKSMPDACKDRFGRLRVGAAIGNELDYEKRLNKLIGQGVDVIVIDTAHAHSKSVISLCKKIKKNYKIDLIVGNVATASAVKDLVSAGADAIKVGIGPGSICTTRIIAGVGVPQLSAIIECSKGLKESKIPLIADGGIRFSGDIVKAISAGANVVMIGSLLAGTKETPGEIILYEGRKYKTYRGMGSVEAMEKGARDRYFQQNEKEKNKLVPEGIVGRVPFKGDVSEVLYQLVGGLKSGMGYTGSKDINNLKANTKFVKISNAASIEGHPHNINITREAPNYSKN
tara:strand:+ start:1893 stop:3362 length:1470 start_codon:yes stop_codon:yes gene_type:complete